MKAASLFGGSRAAATAFFRELEEEDEEMEEVATAGGSFLSFFGEPTAVSGKSASMDKKASCNCFAVLPLMGTMVCVAPPRSLPPDDVVRSGTLLPFFVEVAVNAVELVGAAEATTVSCVAPGSVTAFFAF